MLICYFLRAFVQSVVEEKIFCLHGFPPNTIMASRKENTNLAWLLQLITKLFILIEKIYI